MGRGRVNGRVFCTLRSSGPAHFYSGGGYATTLSVVPNHRAPKRAAIMKLTVKTLKGGKFTVEVEPSNTVGEAKGIIVSLVHHDRPTDGGLAKDDPVGRYAPVLEGLCSALHDLIY